MLRAHTRKKERSQWAEQSVFERSKSVSLIGTDWASDICRRIQVPWLGVAAGCRQFFFLAFYLSLSIKYAIVLERNNQKNSTVDPENCEIVRAKRARLVANWNGLYFSTPFFEKSNSVTDFWVQGANLTKNTLNNDDGLILGNWRNCTVDLHHPENLSIPFPPESYRVTRTKFNQRLQEAEEKKCTSLKNCTNFILVLCSL